MRVLRRFSRSSLLIGLLIGLLILPSTGTAQSVSTQIQIAINRLVTGVTPFTAFRTATSSYLNWGSTQGEPGYGVRDSAGNIQVKNSGGVWTTVVGATGNPIDGSYWTRVPEASLTNETALSALATGIVTNTTGTGVPVIYTGTSCTNQFVRSLAGTGVATCNTVALLTDTSGTLSVARGGTGLTAGTSGGVLAFASAGALASSTELFINRLVIGGGAGATPTVVGSLGTTTTVLHGNAAGAPTFSAVSLTTDVSGILPGANGGTANGFFAVAGPAATLKTYTLPNVSTTILTTNAAITAPQGGTGQTAYTIGDLLFADTATTLARLADVATGNALISGGVGVAPSWGKIGLSTHVSGTLSETSGGTGQTAYTTGDLLFASSGTTLAKLAAVASGSVLASAGVATAPAWSSGPTLSSVTTTVQFYGVTGNCATAPPFSFTGRTTTGLCSAAADNWRLVGGGVTGLQGNLTEVHANLTVRPITDNTIDLGTAAIRWRNIYTSADQFNAGDYRGDNGFSRLNLNTDGAANFADAAGTSWSHLRFGPATTAGWRLNFTGNLVNFREGDDSAFVGAGVSQLNLGAVLTLSATAPTISAGFGTSPSVTAGTSNAFRVDVGTGGVATSGTVGLPAATTGWNCHVENLTAVLANRTDQRTVQLSSSTTTAVVENQTVSTGAVLAWTASDILSLVCLAF